MLLGCYFGYIIYMGGRERGAKVFCSTGRIKVQCTQLEFSFFLLSFQEYIDLFLVHQTVMV